MLVLSIITFLKGNHLNTPANSSPACPSSQAAPAPADTTQGKTPKSDPSSPPKAVKSAPNPKDQALASDFFYIGQ